jgi:hypothetical protein
MYISDFYKLYPDAKCIGPEGIAQKKPDVKWAGVFGEGGESKTYGFEDEVRREPLPLKSRHFSRWIPVTNLLRNPPWLPSLAQTAILPRPREQGDRRPPHAHKDAR